MLRDIKIDSRAYGKRELFKKEISVRVTRKEDWDGILGRGRDGMEFYERGKEI